MGARTRPQIAFAFSMIVSFFLIYQIIHALSFLHTTVDPEVYLIRSAIALAGLMFAILGGWYALKVVGGLIYLVAAVAVVFFVATVSSFTVFLWTVATFLLFFFLLYRMDDYFENQIANAHVDKEQLQNQKNDLEASYKIKGEGISILFEKYSTYYNLRKLTEELASILSVEVLARTVVERTMGFIPRGDVCLLSLAGAEGRHLDIIARHPLSDENSKTPKQSVPLHEDLFDLWVVKNRRRLIVQDTHQDFRFDLKETARFEQLRSAIIAPLLHEGRVIGTLRINSTNRDGFTNDDLRLLDTIAVLTSSAVSIAMLYERTEELAIKDSLTGLYVRRYFFDRLKEEHRRALLTKRPLSMLMCDLDHFKECNDRYGHAVGDLILIHFTKILNENAEHAMVGRFGGEEFSVLVPETSKENAALLAEKIRKAIEETPFQIRREKIRVTVSIGLSNFPDDALDLESLLHKSDQALYEAKRSGRNKVCLSKS